MTTQPQSLSPNAVRRLMIDAGVLVPARRSGDPSPATWHDVPTLRLDEPARAAAVKHLAEGPIGRRVVRP
jgi:hypothetical protein